ncbi:unnamed protein product [Tetraodon nigroviridis]|uniref:(spotted green pufferfish) hypothetical protein n=1 Tax=Tetraodon nigroviridis TaxID=99883 RepID=Q4RYN2_TETNG|nr:unnamed protein product [Tetraodon nigroviridis]
MASMASPADGVQTERREAELLLLQGPRLIRSDLNLMQLIKAGKEGVFYQARMTRGTCKGHAMFTCKISKEGVRHKHVEAEVSIMRKLVHHKNILQLLDWNTSEGEANTPVLVAVLRNVTPPSSVCRTFHLDPGVRELRHPEDLPADPQVPPEHQPRAAEPLHHRLLPHRSGHAAPPIQNGDHGGFHALMRVQSLNLSSSLQIVHCDLALRNIMVNKFPWEVKVAEFSLARDMNRMSRRSSRWRSQRRRVPLRWYPPEYFKNHFYGFKGDVWAFGIVLWEMQMFGELEAHVRASNHKKWVRARGQESLLIYL